MKGGYFQKTCTETACLLSDDTKQILQAFSSFSVLIVTKGTAPSG